LKNESKIVLSLSIAILLMMSVLVFISPVNAQTTYTNLQEGGSIKLPSGTTPDHTEETRAFLSFSPNIIGKGQTLLVNVWLNPASHVSRYFTDYEIIFTKPDGTKETITTDSYRADTTAYLEYVVDQVGEWKIQFIFPGGYFPAGNYTVFSGAFVGSQVWSFSESTYYEPSSTEEQTLIVQEDMVWSWPPAALPTDYWTRPASIENREWWPILGNYPGTGYIGGGTTWDALYPDTNPVWNPTADFHPWVTAPNSAHVVWRKQNAIAGLIGGQTGQFGLSSGGGSPSVIYSGRCYQTYTKPGVGSVAACYDLRTGEIYYEIPTASGGVTPSYISYVEPGGGSVPGAEAQSTYYVELISITTGSSGARLLKVNPWSGAVTNISLSPLTTQTNYYYMNSYVLTVQDLGATAGTERYRLLNWTTTGSGTFASRLASNTTFARPSLTTSVYDPLTDAVYAFNTALLVDFNVGMGATVASVQLNNSTGIYEQMRIQAYRLSDGVALWDKLVDTAQYSRSCYIADHGKIAVLTQLGYFLAYDLQTGTLAWQSETMDYPWSSASFGAYALQSGYGLLFREAYDAVYAFDWETGKIAWKYTTPADAAFESPYNDGNGTSVYPFNTGGFVADGKLYTYNTEHTASWPRTRGWAIRCINVTNGEEVWHLAGEISPGAVADGYLAASNSWDGHTYVFGKGLSETTISAPQTAVTLGDSIIITGTVLDQSPAQPGTACVSKESMTTQMEYLHMQQPIAGLWGNATIAGVPVSIDAIDPNGNSVHIATVTSDGYSGTFSYTWTPTIAGDYMITATFMGDDSYGSSFATAYASFVEAPAVSTPTPAQTTLDTINNTTFIAGIIATIIAVALATMLILRKRP
jgi:hypothetical protein